MNMNRIYEHLYHIHDVMMVDHRFYSYSSILSIFIFIYIMGYPNQDIIYESWESWSISIQHSTSKRHIHFGCFWTCSNWYFTMHRASVGFNIDITLPVPFNQQIVAFSCVFDISRYIQTIQMGFEATSQPKTTSNIRPLTSPVVLCKHPPQECPIHESRR